jgi:hypothetical protein
MENHLEAGLKLIDALQKTKGKYVDQTTGIIKQCGAIGALATEFKDKKYIKSSLLFVPITEIIGTEENPQSDFQFEVSPFIGATIIEKENYPVVKNSFSKSVFKVRGYKDLMVQYNQYARDHLNNQNLRFVAVFIIEEIPPSPDTELKIVPIDESEYFIE